MMIEKISIKREKIAFHGELKLIDNDLSKEDSEEMISRLVSWKLGPVLPTRHFEMVYNSDGVVEVDVFVSILKPSEGHVDTVKYLFNKLMEFIDLYVKVYEEISVI
jgi:hypothetical protein